MRRHSICLLLLLVTLFLPLQASAYETVTICGTGDSQKLLRNLARAFEESHPGSKINVPDSIGSSGGIKATAAGKCDLGRVARPLKEKEKVHNLNYLLFAYSPVVFLANSSVQQIRGITSKQVVDIFSGKISYWSQIDGPHKKIYVAHREKGDSSRSVISKNIPGFKEIKNKAGKTLYTTQENIETIATYKNTIGYSPLSEAINKPGLIILELDGVYPSADTIQNKSYRLSTHYGLVWKDGISSQAQDFINFLSSPAAAKIIRTYGAIPALSH